MNTIIELNSVYDYSTTIEDGELLHVDTVGYYSCYENVEEAMKKLCESDDSYRMFLTNEFIIDILSPAKYGNTMDSFLRLRQYMFIDGSVVMIHETPKDYKGHIASEYDYKSGDIIEWIDGHSNVYTGIVCMPPISVAEVKVRNIEVDTFDDCYHVYCLGDGDTHEHIPTVHILGYAEVSEEERKKYEDKLKERNEVNGKR